MALNVQKPAIDPSYLEKLQARQLRRDYPSAFITWAISDRSSGLLANNPDIDEVWEIPVDRDSMPVIWSIFEREADRLYARREFDHIVLSQIWPNNLQNYDGTVRPSILRSYGRPITVPIENVIRLTDDELERTEGYALQNGLAAFRHRILFECSSRSGQSFITPDLAQEVARRLYELIDDATVIFSTDLPMQLADPRSRYAGTLSLRETAHLTRHCTLFVGAGSGGTVAASSTASRPLPMILLLKKSTSMYASFAHDFEYFGVADRKVLEMTDERPARIAQCIASACASGIDAAQIESEGRIPIKFDHYFSMVRSGLLERMRYLDAARVDCRLDQIRHGRCSGKAADRPQLVFCSQPSCRRKAARRACRCRPPAERTSSTATHTGAIAPPAR